ncbi:MAG: hypothetical protein ACK40G_05125 [Cytophagaceae bacterium]
MLFKSNTFQVFVTIIFLFIGSAAFPQEIKIHYSKSNIQVNDLFTITINMPDEKKKEIGHFPEIPDLVKRNTYFKKEEKRFIIEQNYQSRKEGLFELKEFRILINGKLYVFEGIKIKVSGTNISAKETKEEENYESFPVEGFFSITASKKKLIVGEGFLVTASLLLSSESKNEFNFIDLEDQIALINSKLKQCNCWFDQLSEFRGLESDTITLNDKNYRRFTFLKQVIFPLSSDKIVIPSFYFKLLAYKTSKHSSHISREGFVQNFHSDALEIKLANQDGEALLPAGKITFLEKFYPSKITVGKAFTYEIEFSGDFNPSLLMPVNPSEINNLEFYPPKITSSFISDKNGFRYVKTFKYQMVAREPGQHSLSNELFWSYFNTEKQRTDTLRSKIIIPVKGESKKNTYISSPDEDSFYSLTGNVSNKIRFRQKDDFTNFVSNLIILFLLLTTVILILKK